MYKRIVCVVTIILVLVCYAYMGSRMHQWETFGKKDHFKSQGIEGLCQQYKNDMHKWKRKHGLPWLWTYGFDGTIDDWFPE